jgi:hypothetical protein
MRKIRNNANPPPRQKKSARMMYVSKLVFNYERSSGTRPRIIRDRTVRRVSELSGKEWTPYVILNWANATVNIPCLYHSGRCPLSSSQSRPTANHPRTFLGAARFSTFPDTAFIHRAVTWTPKCCSPHSFSNCWGDVTLIKYWCIYEGESVNWSQMDIKRRTYDIQTWTKHFFLDISLH